MEDKDLEITGAGGGKGGGGGRAAQEAANTLRSSAVVRVVEVLAEGEVEGICGGARGIYINDTPLQNADSSYNFPRAAWDYRVGLPNQDYMKGYSAAEAEIVIGSAVVVSTPITRTTSSASVDAVKVAIQLPQGLYEQDTSNGDLKGTTVSFTIEKKLTSSGTWTGAQTFVIDGKTTSAYERLYRIDRPAGSGTWDIRVTRVTADATLSSLRNATTWARMTEVQEVKDETTEYNNTAVVGLAIDAESVGGQIPRRSYLLKGTKVQIPSNYNPFTRVYSGVWNGTFTTAWTDNPAWCLYDLITNDRYGLGEFITAAQVDKYSFYDAGVYSDELVPDGKGGYEPRFTFNAVISDRVEAFRILQSIAGSMRATLGYFNGLLTILQDRPSSPVKLITKANVIDGLFDYKGTTLNERHTAVNVTFNDREDRHLQRITTIDSSTTSGSMQTALAAAESKYGYNPADIGAFGATTEGQAIRHGRWLLDTELNQTEVAAWRMSFNGFDLLPNDVVSVYDEDYAATVGGARIVSVTGTAIVVDRVVTLTAGSTISVQLADGKTIETKNIVQTSGNTNSFNVTVAFSQAVLPGADAIVKTTASPRQFKIIGLKQEEANIIAVEAVYHDPNKYARVETGVSVPSPIFSNAERTVTSVPTNLSFRESSINVDNTIKRSLLISWGAPATGVASYYSLQWRRESGNWETVSNLNSVSYELTNVNSGAYQVRVYAHSSFGNQSTPATGSYTIAVATGGASALNAPTTLVEQNGGSTAFANVDLNFKWTNPSGNALVTTATLRDFEVRIIETAGSTVLRTYYVAPVAAGSIQSSSYTFAQNNADSNNAPRRSIRVEVRCRDTNGNVSAAAQTTFTNAAPAVPSSIAVTSANGGVKLTYTKPTDVDFVGVLIWRSTTSGFTPSAGNLVYDTTDNYVSDFVSYGTTYYYKIAAYDTFGKALDGTGLNVSVQQSGSALAPDGIPEVTALPSPTGYSGPKIVLNTTDGKLYSYISGAWQQTIPEGSGVADGTITLTKFASGLRPVEVLGSLPTTGNVEGRLVHLTGDNKLYRYDSVTAQFISAVDAADLTGTINPARIADGSIAGTKFASGIEPITVVTSVSGTLSTRQIFNTTDQKLYKWNGSAYTATITGFSDLSGAIANSQVSAGTIGADKLVANSITTSQITAGGVNGDRITANTLDAGKIVAGTITSTQVQAGGLNADRITAGTITTDRMTANTINGDRILANTLAASKIVANSITAGQIQAGAIGADQIAAGAIRTDKLLVTGRGQALNADPNTQDINAWNGSGITIVSDVTSPNGATALDCAVAGTVVSELIPIDPLKNYNLRMSTKLQTGTTSTTYLTVIFYDGLGSIMNGNSYPTGWPSYGTYHYFGIMGSVLPTSWTEYRISFGPGESAQIPAMARFCRVGVLANYSGTGTQRVTNIRLMEKANADLIVDGSILASKIAANTITGDKLYVGVVEASKIQTASLAASSVTANQIASNAVTADKILAGEITANKLQAGILSSDNVLTRGLTVRDNSGNVILSAGTPLPAANISPASGWLNSNIAISGGAISGIGTGNGTAIANSAISIGSNGALSGAGGGQVTMGGLGYSGDLAATRDLKLVPRNACYVNGNTIGRNSGGNAWDSDVYSTTSISYGCFAQATIPSLGMIVMFGLNSDPTTDSSYSSIDYAMYFTGDGNLYKYESGSGTYIGTYSAGSTGQVIYDGSYIRYLLNGTQVSYTYIGNNNTPYFFDSSFYSSVSTLTDVRFMPYGNPSAVSVGNPITTGNVTTYISGAAIGTAQIGAAAIGTAQIGDAAITNAKIGSLAVGSGNIQDLSVGTIKIASGAVSTTYSASSAGTSAAVTLTIPSGARGLVVMAFMNGEKRLSTVTTTADSGGKNPTYTTYTYTIYRTAPAVGSLAANTTFGSTTCIGAGSYSFSDPTPGTFTFTATRAADSSQPGSFNAWVGNISVVVIVTQR